MSLARVNDSLRNRYEIESLEGTFPLCPVDPSGSLQLDAQVALEFLPVALIVRAGMLPERTVVAVWL